MTYLTFWKEQPTLLQRIRLNIRKANYIILLKQLHPKNFYCVEFMTFLIVNNIWQQQIFLWGKKQQRSRRNRRSTPVARDDKVENPQNVKLPENYMREAQESNDSDSGSIQDVTEKEPPRDLRLSPKTSPILSLSDNEVIAFPGKNSKQKKKGKSSTPKQASKKDDPPKDDNDTDEE